MVKELQFETCSKWLTNQHTGPADQSEHIVLFGRWRFIKTGTM